MKKFLSFSAALMMVLLTAVAAILPLADLYATEGQRLLDEWLVTEWLVAAEQAEAEKDSAIRPEFALPPKWLREQVQRFMSLAARLDPFNSAAVNTLGYLHEARSAEEDRVVQPEEAIDCYRRATALRPAAADGWTSLTRLKLEQGALDEELAVGMQTVLMLGPWDKSVQLTILEAALPAWQALSAELRSTLRSSVDRGLQTDPAIVMDLVEEYGYVQGTISEQDALELGLLEISDAAEYQRP
ncbi:MAG: hypothetical protein WAN46_16190 [Gammaproteobacteria bacterium]|jgi:tetratricopeptide (TPR) repeat protein